MLRRDLLPPKERKPQGSPAREAELREILRESVGVLGDTFSLAYLLVTDREKGVFVCGFLEGAGLLKQTETLELSELKSVERYGLDLVLMVLRPDPIDFHRMGHEMRELGLDPEVLNVKADYGFELCVDVTRFNKQTKKILNRMTSKISDAHEKRRKLSEAWLAFRRKYKKAIGHDNKYLSSAKAALDAGQTTPAEVAGRCQEIQTTLAEAHAEFDRLRGAGQVAPEDVEGWETRITRCQERLKKITKLAIKAEGPA